MKPRYTDITSQIMRPPKWWDEAGVPRYDAFDPSMCANTEARQALLVKVACRHCGRTCDVAVSNDRPDLSIVVDLRVRGIGGLYGLLPHFNHCGRPDTGRAFEIVSAWVRSDMATWEEIDL